MSRNEQIGIGAVVVSAALLVHLNRAGLPAAPSSAGALLGSLLPTGPASSSGGGEGRGGSSTGTPGPPSTQANIVSTLIEPRAKPAPAKDTHPPAAPTAGPQPPGAYVMAGSGVTRR